MSVSFEVSPADADVIARIATRAVALDRLYNGANARKPLDWAMDFTAVHANGCPLRLAELLEARDGAFGHDAFGIARHLDRSTGKLGACFVPRFAVPQMEEA